MFDTIWFCAFISFHTYGEIYRSVERDDWDKLLFRLSRRDYNPGTQIASFGVSDIRFSLQTARRYGLLRKCIVPRKEKLRATKSQGSQYNSCRISPVSRSHQISRGGTKCTGLEAKISRLCMILVRCDRDSCRRRP
jgi:hypothetical protein